MDILFALPESALAWVDYAATWIGFSTVIGLIASLLVMRRHQPNTFVTILIGYIGTVGGWALARNYIPAARQISEANDLADKWKEELLSPATFLIGIVGAAALLFLFKLIAKQGGGESLAPPKSEP